MANLNVIKQQIAKVPTLPGVYLWKDADGQVIYVGKAKQLRARMKQYVMGQDERAKIPMMLEQIESFDYVVTENERESLVLENNLIKQYAPFFNADFKDDKSYPFIAITAGDTFPALKYTRERHRKDTHYFGPYTNSRAARSLIDIVRKIVPICTTKCAEWRRMNRIIERDGFEAFSQEPHRPCFDCHVGIGPGACCGAITQEAYRENVVKVERFLHGHHREFIGELTDEMDAAARDLDFERAERVKSRIDIIRSLSDRQHAITNKNIDADVIGIYREETITGVHVLMVREGSIVNKNEFILNKGKAVPDDDLLHMFLLRYYDATTSIPKEVIIPWMVEDASAMEAWLTEKLASPYGAHVHFETVQRGDKHDLLNMATVNAKHTLMRYKVRTNYDDKRINQALIQLESALALDRPPLRIECFDVSTIHGAFSVASMVVFTDGKPDKNQYRRFRIRMESEEANDFAMMSEVLGRRYAPERMADQRFGSKPDLLIVDGGKPQLHAAEEQLAKLGITDIGLAGLAKRDEELFVPWQDTGPVVLPSGSPSLYLVKRVRDEAHRCAISFHRELRGKGMTESILNDVPGLGPVRRKALRKHFKSFKRLREASLQDIKDAHVVPDAVAQDLYELLEQYNDMRETSHQDADQNKDVNANDHA